MSDEYSVHTRFLLGKLDEDGYRDKQEYMRREEQAGSYVVSLYGLDGKREHWMPGNRRKGTGPREKRPFDSQAEAQGFVDASNWPQGDVYQCSICGKWHLSKPRRR